MKCPHCGKKITSVPPDFVILDKGSVRTIARNSKLLLYYLESVLGEKIDARKNPTPRKSKSRM